MHESESRDVDYHGITARDVTKPESDGFRHCFPKADECENAFV